MSRIHFGGEFWACFAGVITMIVLSVLVMLVLPIFILNEYLPMEYTTVPIIISMGIIVFFGSIVTGLMSESRRVLLQFLSCCCFYLIILFVSIEFFGGLSKDSVYNLAACGVACVAAILTTKRTKKPVAKRKKRRGNR